MHWRDRFKVYWYHRKQTNRSNGDKAKALGWTGEESQLCRFEVIARSADFEGRKCLRFGLAAMASCLNCSTAYRIQYYTGVDQHAGF